MRQKKCPNQLKAGQGKEKKKKLNTNSIPNFPQFSKKITRIVDLIPPGGSATHANGVLLAFLKKWGVPYTFEAGYIILDSEATIWLDNVVLKRKTATNAVACEKENYDS